MKRLIFAAFAGIILSGPAIALAAPLPQHGPLAGFHSVDGARGGRLLCGTVNGPFSSPAEALGATLRRLRSYFTGPLPVSGALQSSTGVAALFRAHLGRTPVVGLVLIAPAPKSDARVAALFDTPDRAGRSLRAFASPAALDAPSGSAPAALSRETFPDGSGTIGVPAGWHIASGSRGMVDVVSESGAEAHIGIAFPVWDPRAGFADPTRMQIPFTADPAEALAAVTNRVWSMRGVAAPQTDVLDVHPVNPPLGNGRAALVHGRVGGAKTLEFVTLVNSAPLRPSAWMFYATTLSSPPQHFARDYPLMLAIWKSYRVDPGYQRSVQANTAQTLQSAVEIMNSGTLHSIDAADQTQAGIDNIINGNEILERTADGTHWLGDAGAARALADQYPGRYRIVPTDEYRNGEY